MTPFRIVSLVLLGSALLSSCVRRMPEADPADIPRLEEALRSDPGNPEILAQLGTAQYRARDYRAAEATLQEAIATGGAPEAAFLYLGLAREDQEKWGEAREAYSLYVEEGHEGEVREEIQHRLALMARRELRARALETLAREDEISARDPEPGSVAVFPFLIATENEELEPLQVALADMMTTDLSLSGGLTVLERAQVQSLLTEMALTEAGFTSPETGARAGRMLRAEHVVQGALTTLPQEVLLLDAGVLNTTRGSTAGEASAQDLLSQLFDMEKETVFAILDILGVTLTPTEREAIDQNRASNLLAFLTYGQGLMAMDRGSFNEAQEFFNQALLHDPGFGPAQAALDHAANLVQAGAVSTAAIGSLAAPALSSGLSPAVEDAVATVGGVSSISTMIDNVLEGVAPTPSALIVNLGSVPSGAEIQGQIRDPTQESGGQEGVTTPTTAIIQITITRPGGGN